MNRFHLAAAVAALLFVGPTADADDTTGSSVARVPFVKTYGKSGFAHLFEHMLFQGSEHVGEDKHFDILKKIGATGVNGTTNSDRTNYFEVVPSHQVEVALWLESDRMGYLLPVLTKGSLDNQIEVVRNERRQNYDNRPYRKALFATFAAMYPEGHPYRYLTIGKHEDLASATLEDVKSFYRRWYAPANATLTLAGDFEIEDAKRLVQKWFGGFPKAPKPTSKTPETPVLTEVKRVEVSDSFAKLRQVNYVWHTPKLYAPGDAELDIAADALARTGTGRLYKILVHEKQLAQSVSVYQASSGFSSLFTVSVMLKSDVDMAEVEKIVAAELDLMRRDPITKREFDRAVTNIEAGKIWSLESLNARANLLQSYNHFLGDPGAIGRDLARYTGSSPARVRDVVARYLGKNNRAEIITVPAQ
jgi:zinc protease